MAKFVTDRITRVTPQQFVSALSEALLSALHVQPTKQSVCVLAAQSALETGRWAFCHNYNFGNVKSVEGDMYDYTFFACGEDLPILVAQKFVAASDLSAPCKIVESWPTENLADVMFYPDHPACRFRAYVVLNSDNTINEQASLTYGMSAYLMLLQTRFAKAWPAVLAGDPRAFVQALKAEDYFTAPEKPYEDSVSEIFQEFMSSTTI
jgi:hypothetical protein